MSGRGLILPDMTVIRTEVELLQFLAADCGAEGFTYDTQAKRIHALRWFEGFPVTVKSYEAEAFDIQ